MCTKEKLLKNFTCKPNSDVYIKHNSCLIQNYHTLELVQ